MSLTYSTWLSQLANLMAQDPTDANFLVFKDGCIDYSEQRIYRELDLQVTRVTDSSANLNTNSRTFTLPSANGVFVVVEQMSVITPVGSSPTSGTKVSLQPVTKEFIDYTYPNVTTNTGVPQYFAPLSNTVYYVAPAPDAAYNVEVVGTIRPAPLSSTNTTTFLTTYLPDLFMAASMIFATAYQRDFGAQADDPQRAASWESQYEKLMASANLEELRKRFMSQGWQPMTVSPVATPPRV